MSRFFAPLIAAAVIGLAGLASADMPKVAAGEGPQIEKPACEEGKCPTFTKGFAADALKLERKDANKSYSAEEMGRRRYSDRCFVTTVDYCYMDGYAPVGASCYCTDGYVAYAGVVY